MKKFTLLAGLAAVLGAGSAVALDKIGAITVSDPESGQYQYYRIANMRTQRLSYVNKNVYGPEGADGPVMYVAGGSCSTGTMPELTPDGEDMPLVFTGDDIYAGLAQHPTNKKWFMGFSCIDSVIHPATRFWYFTADPRNKQRVYIHNAVLDGALSQSKKYANATQGGTTFDATGNPFYVLNVTEQLHEVFDNITAEVEGETYGLTDVLTEEQIESSFALSYDSDPTAAEALDASNFLTFTYEIPDPDVIPEDLEEGEEMPMIRYGYAGVKPREWSPLKDNNANGLTNNGSLWFVTEALEADALAAKEAYREVIEKSFRDAARANIAAAYNSVAATLKNYQNLPGLVTDQNALAAAIALAENPTVDVTSVKDLASEIAAEEAAEVAAQKLIDNVVSQIGTNAVVTFQAQFPLRDYQGWIENVIENVNFDDEQIAAYEKEYALGNAYLSADRDAWFTNGGLGMQTVAGDLWKGVGPVLEKDAKCEWTLEHVAGTRYFKLFNKETQTYIRAFQANSMAKELAEYCEANGVDFDGYVENEEGEEVLKAGSAFNFSWATTALADSAAMFAIQPSPALDNQAALSEADEELISTLGDYENFDGIYNDNITDNVRLTAFDAAGEITGYIHRARQADKYQFLNWPAAAERWYAESNAFHVGVIVPGQSGIQNVEAPSAKVQGIYDLQGRRVSKPGKGLYIVNGVKTVIR